jgi:hypothetical protein
MQMGEKMKVYNIPIESFKPHGKVSINIENEELHMTSYTDMKTSYACLENKFKIPFRIDMTLKMDSPAFYWIIGNALIGFGSEDSRNPYDIIEGKPKKPNTHIFDNYIPVNEYVDISVTYGRTAFWIVIGDECRCLSKKDPYIKVLKNNAALEEFTDGFKFAVACDKRTDLVIKSLSVTEYKNDEPSAPEEIHKREGSSSLLEASGKPVFSDRIKSLPPRIQDEIMKIDEWLMKDMKKSLKFKRIIDPYSKITYVSPWGFRYKITVHGAYMQHDVGWIGYNAKWLQEKHGGPRKADYTIETLNKLSETSPEFAQEMFFRIKECNGCGGTAGGNCINRTVYEYNGERKVSCGGSVQFKMFPLDFEDLRKVMNAINEVLIINEERK